ncbi:MAG: heme o synthase [Chloroflexota bacterium]
MKSGQTNPQFPLKLASIRQKYWPLIKSLQTGLLLITGLAGYMSSRCPVSHIPTLLSLTGSLFLAISGSTVLNMWFDRDIDAIMERSKKRPLPTGLVQPGEALTLGLAISVLGVGWALILDPIYGTIVFAGLFFDMIVYTVWLKRRTAWSIVWGGISGGMPILAGRALGLGHIDWIGIALAASVLFWIPTHIMTFNIRYLDDYNRARVPTFASLYGVDTTRKIIAASSVLATIFMGLSSYGVGLTIGYTRILAVLSGGLLILALYSAIKPSEKLNFGLFKFASIYMLSSMLLISA